MCCRQHGQGPRSRVLHLVVILATKQHHQLQPVVAIGQEPLLYLWGTSTRLRGKGPHLPSLEREGRIWGHVL